MKLEERTCACGCGKTFRCLPTSQTRYSSLHCMEAAGALPPPAEKFGKGRPARPAMGAAVKEADENDENIDEKEERNEDSPGDSDDSLLIDDDMEAPGRETEPLTHRAPPEVDPAA